MSNRKFQIDRFLNGKNRRNRKTNRNRPTPRAFRQNFGDDSGYASVNLHDLAQRKKSNQRRDERCKADRKRSSIYSRFQWWYCNQRLDDSSLEQFMVNFRRSLVKLVLIKKV